MQTCARIVHHRLPVRTAFLLRSEPLSDGRTLFHSGSVKFRRKKEDSKGPIRSLPSQQNQGFKDPLTLFKPVAVKPNPDDINFGEELSGQIFHDSLIFGGQTCCLFMKKHFHVFLNFKKIRFWSWCKALLLVILNVFTSVIFGWKPSFKAFIIVFRSWEDLLYYDLQRPMWHWECSNVYFLLKCESHNF